MMNHGATALGIPPRESPSTSAGITDSISRLRFAVEERATRTGVWAKEIEGLSSGKIKATVHALGDISDLREAVDAVFNGHRHLVGYTSRR